MDNYLFPGMKMETENPRPKGQETWSEAETAFERARKHYPKKTGKAGHAKEWEDFRRYVKDWKTAAFELYPAIRIIELYHERIEPKELQFWPDFCRFVRHRKWEQALELVPILQAKGLL